VCVCVSVVPARRGDRALDAMRLTHTSTHMHASTGHPLQRRDGYTWREINVRVASPVAVAQSHIHSCVTNLLQLFSSCATVCCSLSRLPCCRSASASVPSLGHTFVLFHRVARVELPPLFGCVVRTSFLMTVSTTHTSIVLIRKAHDEKTNRTLLFPHPHHHPSCAISRDLSPSRIQPLNVRNTSRIRHADWPSCCR